jgi:alkanesulfonate monooxygenase SsuD/methylene tetrahydromethanopterin reductase-like flavin-dependent oxidoreductase (luciferase family)
MFLLRFDMRAPTDGPASARDLYQAALDMSVWGERHGCFAVVLSEHHASPDGYLPTPLILASAIAARTATVPIQVAAVLLNLYDPIRLAEEMAVLDVLSGGRVSYVIGLGYRPEEYAMFGVPMHGRGRRLEELVHVLRRAWTGEPFEFDGRTVRVTPKPCSDGGPALLMGGNTRAAARRAARCGLGLQVQSGDATIEAAYREACATAGVEPCTCIVPPAGLVTCAFVAEDPERAWRDLGPYLLHDAQSYAAWLGAATSAVKSGAHTVDELRKENGSYRIFTPAEAVDHIARTGFLLLQPLCGGVPPELAWRSLHLLADRVLPEVHRSSAGTGSAT